MPIKKSNILGVISFGSDFLELVMVPHPERPGSFIVDQPESEFVKDKMAELVSALIGVQINGSMWGIQSLGSDHKTLYLKCPHKVLILITIEDGASNPSWRREFVVSSDCIACKKSRKALQENQASEKMVQKQFYPPSAEVIRQRIPLANPDGLQHLRRSFKGKFRDICEADVSDEDDHCQAVVNLCFEEDMAEIEREISLCQSALNRNKALKLVLNQQQQSLINTYDDDDMDVDHEPCDMDLEMKCHPEEPQLFRPWL